MIQKLPLGIAAALLLALVAFTVAPAEDASAQDPDIIIDAGRGEVGYSVNAFLPGTVTIVEGQSITWRFPWFEPHIVAFFEGAPPAGEPAISPSGTEWPNDDPGYVFSGDIFGDPSNPPTFGPILFPEAGTYAYFCPIHPLMTANVVVVESGDVDTQAEVDARANSEYAPRIAAVKALAASLSAAGATVTPRADGTNLYQAKVGGVTAPGDDAMQFFPAAANIRVGDTVRWTTDNATPHTVSFNFPPGPPQGDPFTIPRTSETTFAGQGQRHSGILWTVPEPNSFTSYELTFTATGSFTYVCILHAPQGMVGTVNVGAAPPPPAPPPTGTGMASDSGTSPVWFLALAGVMIALAGVMIALAGGGVIVSTRR